MLQFFAYGYTRSIQFLAGANRTSLSWAYNSSASATCFWFDMHDTRCERSCRNTGATTAAMSAIAHRQPHVVPSWILRGSGGTGHGAVSGPTGFISRLIAPRNLDASETRQLLKHSY